MSSTGDSGAPAPTRRARGLAARRRARATRRFYLLTAASTVVPGLGLLRTRPGRAKIILTTFVVLILGVLAWGLTQGFTASAIDLGVSRSALLALIAVVLVFAAMWIYGIVATARDNMPEGTSGTPRIAMLTFASLACLLILAPAAQSARYAVIQRSVLSDVFSALAPEGATTPGAGEDPWAGTERVNIMLVGSDAGESRTGIRPDSIMVASVNTQTGETVLLGIPRNLQNIPFSEDNPLHELWPNGYNCGDECLMEAVWTLGSDNAGLFPSGPDDPEAGLVATKDAVSQVLGLDIDYTAVINLAGFTELVDAMKGVEINVKERVCMGCSLDANGNVVWANGEEKYLEPGVRTLNGYQALWYSRSRAQSQDGDFSRMRRQRCMVGALISQVDPMTMVQNYPELAGVLKKNVLVDIPQGDLDEWADLVLRIQERGSIKSLPLTNKNIDVNRPDYEQIHAMVQKSIDPPEPTQKPSSSTSATSEPSTSSTTSTPSGDELSDITATC